MTYPLSKVEVYESFYRYRLIPANRFCNVFLHIYFKQRPMTFHTHPWTNLSLILRGDLGETLIKKYHSFETRKQFRPRFPRIVWRNVSTAHAIEGSNDAVTLFFTFGGDHD